MKGESNDLREDCKYGNKCYQKNSVHHARFKHPPKDEEPPAKKSKTIVEEDPVFLSVNRLFPPDFLIFYDWCKTLNSEDPCKALFDTTGAILSTDFHNLNDEMKWRFYYDPPEFLTLLIQVDKSEKCTEEGEHFGYFWDDPKEHPAFVGRVKNNNSSKITKFGDNLFGAIFNWIKELLIHSDPFKKTKLQKIQESLHAFATSKNFHLNLQSDELKLRNKKVVARPFHGAGLVVPYNKKTCLGYREIPESTASLKKIFKKAAESSEDDRMDTIQELITNVQFANDEGDPGMGLELGLNLFSFENGCDHFHPTIKHLLCVAYNLLNRDHFAKVIETHLSRRRKGEAVLTN
ncbi:Histone PARylation factor 1 [Lepeophtheirus salmonis]|uniref:Histone PARylation factor 1 n=1 Tax=Lepeophtheirus salmonis TaxID=72036 RepID=A0A7R8D327_LEPSM|nr:Histone PARylation factor 1 [Lepeophtheirus salmonis]CAF2961449.1 Histone PARylation factor 1 [Lepeophtheirus salmonis]